MNAQTESHRTENHDLARQIAAAGIPVFPCRETEDGAKAPYTRHGFKEATNDLGRLDAWWLYWPGAVPGIPTGKASGLAVIDGDIDRQSGEACGEAEIEALGLTHPQAVRVRTQSGGVQFLFRHAEGATCTSKQVADHVDTRGEGGYIIAPGSVMGNGARYICEGPSFIEALQNDDLPPYPLDAVQSVIAERKARGRAVSQHQEECPPFRLDFDEDGKATATDAEKRDALKTLLAIAPNALCREYWVKLAFSLKVGFGEELRSDFVAFSLRYIGSPCTEADALHVWNSTDTPREVSSIGPALALLRDAVGEERWRAVWHDTFKRHRKGSESAISRAQDPSNWSEPAPRFLRLELPPAPELPLRDVLVARLAQWVEDAAEAKGAPIDYVFAALLAVAGATIGNTRWASPWRGWAEPPVIWSMCVGLPSAGKSPAIDAVVQPLRKAERRLRDTANADTIEWEQKAELAKLAKATWKKAAKDAIEAGETPPKKPQDAIVGPKPHIPRLVVNDGTIERLGVILAHQPKGTLQMRDELAGWLEGMQRYSGGASDRPFWLEAFGGRGFTVERMGREPLTIDRLTIGVVGGIQPDRLKTLLFKSDDDGLLARFLPIYPNPAPIKRPQAWADEALIDGVFAQLLALDMVTDEKQETRPWFIPFTDEARDLMDEFRRTVRGWETDEEGLMLSFIGKLPGLAARLSLVLAYLNHAASSYVEPTDGASNAHNQDGGLGTWPS